MKKAVIPSIIVAFALRSEIVTCLIILVYIIYFLIWFASVMPEDY